MFFTNEVLSFKTGIFHQNSDVQKQNLTTLLKAKENKTDVHQTVGQTKTEKTQSACRENRYYSARPCDPKSSRAAPGSKRAKGRVRAGAQVLEQRFRA